MSYQQVAYEVMKLFLTDFTEEELKNCINRAYDSKFDTTEIAPLKFADGAYYLELFHGSTIAFKDMALSILPHLLITSAKKNNVKNEIVIPDSHIETQERQLWQALLMLRGHRLSFSIQRMVSARFREADAYTKRVPILM